MNSQETAVQQPSTDTTSDRPAFSVPGLPALLAGIVAWLFLAAALVSGFMNENVTVIVGSLILIALTAFLFKGLTVVGPKKVRVMQFFGQYVGSLQSEGMFWVNPLNHPRHHVSLRVRNFETSKPRPSSTPASCWSTAPWVWSRWPWINSLSRRS